MARKNPCRTARDDGVKVEVWIDADGIWVEEKRRDASGEKIVKTVLLKDGDFLRQEGRWYKVERLVPQGRPVVVVEA